MASHNRIHDAQRKRKPQNPELFQGKTHSPRFRNNRERSQRTPQTIHYDAQNAKDVQTQKEVALRARRKRRYARRLSSRLKPWMFYRNRLRFLANILFATTASADNSPCLVTAWKTTFALSHQNQTNPASQRPRQRKKS